MAGRSRKFRMGNMAKSMFGGGNKRQPKEKKEFTAPETEFRKFEMPSINTGDIEDMDEVGEQYLFANK